MAKSSKDGWVDMPSEQPRDCTGCGRPLRMTKDTIWFRTTPELLQTFCESCTSKWRLTRAAQVTKA